MRITPQRVLRIVLKNLLWWIKCPKTNITAVVNNKKRRYSNVRVRRTFFCYSIIFSNDAGIFNSFIFYNSFVKKSIKKSWTFVIHGRPSYFRKCISKLLCEKKCTLKTSKSKWTQHVYYEKTFTFSNFNLWNFKFSFIISSIISRP